LEGKTITLEVEQSDSVALEDRCTLADYNIKQVSTYTCCCFALEDRCTLADYNIKEDSTLHLLLRLCSGPDMQIPLYRKSLKQFCTRPSL
jgi:hypothetical protein